MCFFFQFLSAYFVNVRSFHKFATRPKRSMFYAYAVWTVWIQISHFNNKRVFFLVGVSVAFAVLIARKWNVNNTIRNISILLSLKHCSDGSLFEHIARFLLEIEKTPRYTIQIRWRETGNYLNWEHLFTELNWELCIALEWLCHWFGWMKACGISLCLVVTVSS